jgi:hypothetical protein
LAEYLANDLRDGLLHKNCLKKMAGILQAKFSVLIWAR